MEGDIEQSIVNKIYDLNTLKLQVEAWKASGLKIVFTNGVFDLLHVGHISYLAKSAGLGDKLVIGLNADSSVKRLKGPVRPVNDQNTRAMLLATFFFVSAVVIFDTDTPLALITNLLPDVLVKGADYAIEEIVGATEVIESGGKVKTVQFIAGYSSTAIINRINNHALRA